MKNIVIKLSYILLPVLLFACTDTNVTPNTTNYNKLAEAVSSGSSFNVEMLTKDSLIVGYSKVYFKVTDKTTNQSINQAVLALHPLMDMGTIKHACPWENPSSIKNADGLYEGAILFSMIGTNSWSVSVDVTANNKTESVKFDIPKVIATNPVQKIVVIDSVITSGTLVQTKYPISLVTPKVWKVGMNPFEITINCMQDMMTFPSCNDFSIELTPEMPSMGHGSPNNINPILMSNGHYIGTVNFTMTGAWRVNMLIKKSNWAVAKKAYFDITF